MGLTATVSLEKSVVVGKSWFWSEPGPGSILLAEGPVLDGGLDHVPPLVFRDLLGPSWDSEGRERD